MQGNGQFNRLLRRIAAATNGLVFASIVLLAANARADVKKADEQVVLNVVQERQKVEQRDPLVFFREDLGFHNHSNSWFALRADFREFSNYDSFTRRQEPYVAGIKASWTF